MSIKTIHDLSAEELSRLLDDDVRWPMPPRLFDPAKAPALSPLEALAEAQRWVSDRAQAARYPKRDLQPPHFGGGRCIVYADDIKPESITSWQPRPATPPEPPPPPHAPTAGERRLAEQLEATGWTEVEVIPPARHRWRNHDGAPLDDAIEVVGVDGPDRDWMIRVDGGGDGAAEGYLVTRVDDDEESGRITGPRVPTPNEAVGAWELGRRLAAEAERPRGRKGDGWAR